MSRAKISLVNAETVGPFGNEESASPVGYQGEVLKKNLSSPSNPSGQSLHRLAEVREKQGVSLTRVAQRLGVEIAEARRQEKTTTDLTLTQLYRWREILEVPIGDLLLEADGIPSNPIKNRSQMIKMMKTIRTIIETSKEEGARIQAQLLFDLLVEMMPELKSIAAWPSVGQAREARDLGQAAYRRFDPHISRVLDE